MHTVTEPDFREMVERALPGPGGSWELEADDRSPWIGARPRTEPDTEQGWKLHVSATGASAAAVLARALPVLIDESATFKVAASVEELEHLNEGGAGVEQAGKFITVYPRDDQHAVRLARRLDEATAGLPGPPVRSDRRLRPGSLVHYRYGAFTERLIHDPLLGMVPGVRAPGGAWVADRRSIGGRAPEWAQDPFVHSGVAREERRRPLAGRYLTVGVIHRTPRGEVAEAVDITEVRRCIVKRASSAARAGADGRDAVARLGREAEVLRDMEDDPRFPRLLDEFTEDGDGFLVLEPLEGRPVAERILEGAVRGRLPSADDLSGWGRDVGGALAAMHGRGWAHRDVSPSNVLLDQEGIHLLDFEAAERLGQPGEPLGTPGYSSPEQIAGAAASAADDVFGLGALLSFCATGAEPVFVDELGVALDRPVRLLRPELDPAVARAIEACRAPTERPSVEGATVVLAERDGEPAADVPLLGGSEAMDLARAAAETVVSAALHPEDHRLPDVGHGLAGAVLALAELGGAVPGAKEAVRVGAARLSTLPMPDRGSPLGLYLGHGGVAVALARAARLLGDDDMLERASRRGLLVADVPHASPDLFAGSAGRLRSHLLLLDATADPRHADAAVAAGEHLLSTAEPSGDGLRWPAPAGPGEPGTVHYLGYAHGAAGIGDALLELYLESSDRRFLEGALGAARWLRSLAVPSGGDGLTWPDVEGGGPAGALWCHGATGIGRFLLHLGRLDELEGAADLAAGAAASSTAARFLGPTQCHGLGGTIELLLDGGNDAAAASVAAVLASFGPPVDGRAVWFSDSGERLGPGFLTGAAGVALAMHRLAHPDRPHVLARSERGRPDGPLG